LSSIGNSIVTKKEAVPERERGEERRKKPKVKITGKCKTRGFPRASKGGHRGIQKRKSGPKKPDGRVLRTE